MAVPPERISLKRRRSHEAVDLLRFDHEKPGKRRHTGFLFRRLESHVVVSDAHRPSQPPRLDGIPSVRATAPGDEINDLKKLRSARQAQIDASSGVTVTVNASVGSVTSSPAAESACVSTNPAVVSHPQPRRFHLVSNLRGVVPNVDPSGLFHPGDRKHHHSLRPPLATFVEQLPQSQARASSSTEKIRDEGVQGMKLQGQPSASPGSAHTGQPRNPPSPPSNLSSAGPPKQPRSPAKIGHSMYDHPDTWDLESDQLAEELAAFAMELEPVPGQDDASTRISRDAEVKPVAAPDRMVLDDELVYDTYIRVTYEDMDLDPATVESSVNFGILVVDEEVEDLWEEYLNEGAEDEDEWDSEDSNAEENPANDYPDEEVDSDDEFGRNPYRYRNYTSDDDVYSESYDD
ncbi:hypothetical protein DV735_g2908, partial [Chaetothyriales sp. CBS 134920]